MNRSQQTLDSGSAGRRIECRCFLLYRFNQMVFFGLGLYYWDWCWTLGAFFFPLPEFIARSCGRMNLSLLYLLGWAGVLHDGMDCYD